MADVYLKDNKYDSRSIILMVFIVILVIGTGFGIYNYQKNKAASKAPKVEISTPADNQEITGNSTIVEGVTEPGTKVVISGNEVNVDNQGKYSTEVSLKEGENTITIELTGENGKKQTIEKKVTKVVPEPMAVPGVTDSPSSASYNGSLNNSGPENFWLPEASMLAAAGTFWIAARRRLSKATKK